MRRRHTSKISEKEFFNLKNKSMKSLRCKENCGREVKVDSNTESVICSICTSKKAPPEDRLLNQSKPKNETDKKHRGWKFMKQFVDKNGNVFEKGIENTELKGKFKPTEIKVKSKRERELAKVAKEERAVKRFERKKKILRKENKKKGKLLEELRIDE